MPLLILVWFKAVNGSTTHYILQSKAWADVVYFMGVFLHIPVLLFSHIMFI